jgi:hypothetical protein
MKTLQTKNLHPQGIISARVSSWTTTMHCKIALQNRECKLNFNKGTSHQSMPGGTAWQDRLATMKEKFQKTLFFAIHAFSPIASSGYNQPPELRIISSVFYQVCHLYWLVVIKKLLSFSPSASGGWNQTFELGIITCVFYQVCPFNWPIVIKSSCHFLLVLAGAGIKPSNLGSFVVCFTNSATVTGQL